MDNFQNILKNSTITTVQDHQQLILTIGFWKETNWKLSGIHKLIRTTCNNAYKGQTWRTISIKYKEHIRYIKTNKNYSAYALNILHNADEYRPQEEIFQTLKAFKKRKDLNYWETIHTQLYQYIGIFVTMQQYEHNIHFVCTKQQHYNLKTSN